MFSKKLNVSAEGKYDATKVSIEGITAEELAKIAKENAKLIDIYTALGANENGLSKLDLALAMDGFAKADADGDGKLSKKELSSYAETLNEKYNIDVDRKDLKAFLKSIRKHTKNDEKVATKDVIDADNAAKADAKARAEAEAKAKAEADAKAKAEAEVKAKAEAEAKAKAEAEEARIKDLQTPKTYTVQEGETLTGLLKKSLEAQGIEITDENLAKAKEEFAKNNPGALHGPKGKEYLYAGAEVKIAGNLEDKANGKEINDSIIARNEAKAKAEAEAKAKAEAEAKAKAEAEAKAKAEAEAKAKAEAEAKAKAEQERLDNISRGLQKKYPLIERLPNGYTRRDAPGANDMYFDKEGNRITSQKYREARGGGVTPGDEQTPLSGKLANGYHKRSSGFSTYYYNDKGQRIHKEEYLEAAKKYKSVEIF